MTPNAGRTKRNEKIRELAAEGYTRPQIARIVKLHPNTVGSVLRAYIARGELMVVADSNPKVYYDPHVHAIGADVQESNENGGNVENIATLVSRGWAESRPRGGLPKGWVNMHISGMAITMKIRKTGSFEDVPSPGKGYCGYWDPPKSAGKGMTLHHCHLPYIFLQRKVGAVFRQGSRGGCVFIVNPGRVYFDPRKVSQHQAKQLLLKRAEYIASLLSKNGWQLTDPEIKGRIHIGKEDDELAEHLTAGVHDNRQQITVDFSPGTMECETEIENGIDDEGLEIYANLPEYVREMKAVHANQKEMLKEQAEMIGMLMSNVDSLITLSAKLTTQAAMQMQNLFPRFTGEGYQ